MTFQETKRRYKAEARKTIRQTMIEYYLKLHSAAYVYGLLNAEELMRLQGEVEHQAPAESLQ